jgi:hypothetical protein
MRQYRTGELPDVEKVTLSALLGPLGETDRDRQTDRQTDGRTTDGLSDGRQAGRQIDRQEHERSA